MPLINGQKMACEPCIRGHRSTKCNHANERLMIPVRKPGRPLSSCPHPSSKRCSCGRGDAITAAIPRKQKCGCGSSDRVPVTAKQEPGDPTSTATSPGGDSKANSSFRVQKTTLRRASVRKPSLDPAGLERMDPSQVNILPAYDAAQTAPMNGGMSDSTMPAMGGIPFSSMGIAPSDNSFAANHVMMPVFHQHVPPPMMHPGSSNPTTNGHAYWTTPDASATPTNVTSTKGGCCGGNTNGHAYSTGPNTSASRSCVASSQGGCCGGSTNGRSYPAPNGSSTAVSSSEGCCGKVTNGNRDRAPPAEIAASVPTSDAEDSSENKPKSCCSSGAMDSGHGNNGHMTSTPNMTPQHPPPTHPSHNMIMPPFQAPMPMANVIYPSFFSHPTVFTYPAPFGTYGQPLQPEQWKQMVALSIAQHPPAGGFDMTGVPTGVGPVPYSSQESLTTNPGMTHHCDCGEGCQCVGCAAHPYNEATKEYIRSAMHSMKEQTNRNHSYSNGTSQDAFVTHTSKAETNAIAQATPADGNGSASTSAPQTPSDAASGLNEEQTFPESDFLFIQYTDLGDTCAGDTVSCPCGDDCQCIGCAIHSNPDPTQPSFPLEHYQ